jgi:hypothetical protein
MHVSQIMLVEADSYEQAKEKVASYLLEEESAEWSDWHGGFDGNLAGRWSGIVFDENPTNADILRYSDNPELAESVLYQFLEQRTVELKRTMETLGEGFDLSTAISNYDPENTENYWERRGIGFELYRISKILSDIWSPDTGVYDVTAESVSISYFRERLAESKDKQFLVLVDFHF